MARKPINIISPCDRRAPKGAAGEFFYAHGDAEDLIERSCRGPECRRCDPDFVTPADTGSFTATIEKYRLGPGEHPAKLYGQDAILVIGAPGSGDVRGLVVLANNEEDLWIARRQLQRHRRRWSYLESYYRRQKRGR